MYSYGTEAPVSYFSLEGEFKTRQSSCSGDVESVGGVWEWGGVKGNSDAERDEGWGGGGDQTLYQTDRAIYLASQLSSMQLLSAKIIGKEKAK